MIFPRSESLTASNFREPHWGQTILGGKLIDPQPKHFPASNLYL